MTAPDDRREAEPQLDAFSVDVRDLLERSVANLYSHLVTRPTGRAVRLAIEAQLRELSPPALSLVDLSSVAILDYSCADEVVAKLLLSGIGAAGAAEAGSQVGVGRGSGGPVPGPGAVFFIFQGLRVHHREPILEVLNRHELAAVVRSAGAQEPFQLLGVRNSLEDEAWSLVESRGRIPGSQVSEIFSDRDQRNTVDGLVRRGLLFRHPVEGDLHALSNLARRFE